MIRYRSLLGVTIGAALLLGAAAPALADKTPQSPTTGQPGAPTNTCNPSIPTPGNSASTTGSPFNPNGSTAGNNYAGNPGTHSLASSNSTVAVSQYDVACIQLSH